MHLLRKPKNGYSDKHCSKTQLDGCHLAYKSDQTIKGSIICERVAFIVLYVIASLTLIFLAIDWIIYTVNRSITPSHYRTALSHADKNLLIKTSTGITHREVDEKQILKLAPRWVQVDPELKKLLKTFTVAPKKVIDLGCRTGDNGSLFLTKGTEEYIGMDLAENALNLFEYSQCQKHKFIRKGGNINKSPQGTKHKLVVADMTKAPSFGNEDEYDIAACMDTLMYIPPKHILSVLLKINRCVKIGGIFIGTLLVEENYHCKSGSITVYNEDPQTFLPNLLKLFGFNCQEVSRGSDTGKRATRPKWVFVAKKTHRPCKELQTFIQSLGKK